LEGSAANFGGSAANFGDDLGKFFIWAEHRETIYSSSHIDEKRKHGLRLMYRTDQA
jgi:hypothetical protein